MPPADAKPYTHSACAKCAYPFTPSSRNDAAQHVCPECGSVFPVATLTTQQLTHIAGADCASESRRGRTLALSGYVCVGIVASMRSSPMPFDHDTLFVLGAFAMIALIIMLARVVAALSAIHAPAPATVLLGLGIALIGGLVIGQLAFNFHANSLLTLLLIQIPLFIGAAIILYDTLARARVFPIEPGRTEATKHARRGVRIMLATGVGHIVLSFVIAPYQEQAWYTLMAFTCGSSVLGIATTSRAMRALRRAARPWRSPTPVEDDA